MSETIKGVYEGVSIKKGFKKNGDPWTLYTVLVDGKKYGYGFTMPKAAVGDVVTFEAEQNDKGYWDIDPKTFKATGETRPAQQSASNNAPNAQQTSGLATPYNSDPRQQSIEAQVLIKCAVELAIADSSGLPSVAKYFTTLQGILHPKPAVIKQHKAQPIAVEDDDSDFPA